MEDIVTFNTFCTTNDDDDIADDVARRDTNTDTGRLLLPEYGININVTDTDDILVDTIAYRITFTTAVDRFSFTATSCTTSPVKFIDSIDDMLCSCDTLTPTGKSTISSRLWDPVASNPSHTPNESTLPDPQHSPDASCTPFSQHAPDTDDTVAARLPSHTPHAFNTPDEQHSPVRVSRAHVVDPATAEQHVPLRDNTPPAPQHLPLPSLGPAHSPLFSHTTPE
jgi:hypothetical protein